jgi:hypothetical protein
MAARVASQVLESLGQLRIIDLGVRPANNRSDIGVKCKVGQRKGFECVVRRILEVKQ